MLDAVIDPHHFICLGSVLLLFVLLFQGQAVELQEELVYQWVFAYSIL